MRCWGGDRGDIFAQFGVEDVPARSNMAIQGMGLILDQDGDLPNSRVQTVAQGEIDHPILPSEWRGGLGPVLRERGEPFTFSTRENHRKDIVHGRILSG